jgi:hypothetical protein
MPYVPPHLRPGYVPSAPIVKPDLKGKVHWPTNMNKNTDIIGSSHLGIVAKSALKMTKPTKSALKMTKPIQLNITPLARPSMVLGKSKFNNAVRRHVYKEMASKKRISRRRSMNHKKRLTRRKRSY